MSFFRDSTLNEIRLLQGHQNVLMHAPLLEEFAAICGQPDANINWLTYFLKGGGGNRKRATAVMIVRRDSQVDLQAEDLIGIAFFFEYTVLGLRTWCAVCESVVAREEDRSRVAALSVEEMMRRGAYVIAASYEHGENDLNQPWMHLERPDLLWVRRVRGVKRQFHLGVDYEDTLARLGKTTRRNMRYYRKRFQEKVVCEYLPDAHDVLSERELLALNAQCLNPVSEEEVHHRYVGSVAGSGFLAGLRDADGRWLSAMGGWHHSDAVVVHWQSNAEGYEKDSIVTVMRSFFLENESIRGTKRMMFFAGTSHSMAHVFEDDVMWDLIVRRKSLRGTLLGALARVVEYHNGKSGRMNFLAAALRHEELLWQPTKTQASRWSLGKVLSWRVISPRNS